MSFEPRLRQTLRVPEALWRNLIFAWPTDPGSQNVRAFLGQGALTFDGLPSRWTVPGSGYIPTVQQAMTVAAVMVFSAHPPSSVSYAFGTTGTNQGNGFRLATSSGVAHYEEVASNAIAQVSVTATMSTIATTHRVIATRNSPITAGLLIGLWIDGTPVGSTTGVGSWATPDLCTIGWAGLVNGVATGVFSGVIRDVYVFNRDLTAAEVVQLDAAIR